LRSLETLQDLKDADHRLYGHCGNPCCGRGRPLDLDALIAHYGPVYVVIRETRIARALVCSGCGHKGGKLTINPPT
jgi:hypothetical protein